ncbi:MAG: biotin carboxyl carrier protein [Myxococcota bacterium]|jgi:biotin carboxyl carrier protein
MSKRFITWIDGVEATVELVAQTETAIVARIEDEHGTREVTLAPVETGGGWTLVDTNTGAVHRAVAPLSPARGGEVAVEIGPHRVVVRALDEREAWLGAGDDDAGAGEVTVSMPGRVVKILAQAGEAVVSGQPLLIIEAMKMENEVKTKRDGVVTAVHVTVGESVEADYVLMTVGAEG